MKKIFAGFILPLLILSFIGLSSCKERAAVKQQKETEKEKIDTIQKNFEARKYPIPTSAEVIRTLSSLDVGYIMGISNPVENSKKYLTNYKRALNLGAYGADLSYCTLYNQQQKVFDYLNVIRSLSNELNMSKLYNEDIYNSIRENADNKDKLVDILSSTFNNTYSYLSENDQQNLALLVVGGAWVEGMYLTTHVSEAAYQVAGISQVLIQQKVSFDTFMQVTEPYLKDPDVAEFVKELDPIKNVYAGLTTSLTNQNIIDITKAITGIRDNLVK